MDFFKKNKTLFIVIIIICALIVMWGRSIISRRDPGLSARRGLFGRKAPEETAEEIIPVKVTKAAKMDYKDTITSFGTIKGFEEIPIKFRDNGGILKFYFKEGDEIKKGNIVVSQIQQEEILKLEYSKIEYNKNKTLFELGAITADKLRQAELELQSAEVELGKRNFYAPSDGFMGTRKVNEGELVTPNDIAATFLDIDSVFCEVGIIERDMGKVKVGQKVKVKLETFGNEIFEGVVDSASPMVEGRSRTQTVRILVPNKEHLIKPGMFARAEITTFEKKDAIVVPREALHKRESGYIVFGVVRVVREEEKAPKGLFGRKRKKEETPSGFEQATARMIPVKVERATERLALISEGLAEGQEIILESPKAKEAIKDGVRIEIIGTDQGDVSL